MAQCLVTLMMSCETTKKTVWGNRAHETPLLVMSLWLKDSCLGDDMLLLIYQMLCLSVSDCVHVCIHTCRYKNVYVCSTGFLFLSRQFGPMKQYKIGLFNDFRDLIGLKIIGLKISKNKTKARRTVLDSAQKLERSRWWCRDNHQDGKTNKTAKIWWFLIAWASFTFPPENQY